uniref:Uncharacterized protein n=1 Tax=Tanacetum cinerariifolium TaxID=118510 RepID=A0A6L2LDU7_TANCI|nr:hypothetical protein [Tanacetum cinerariifolium]
MYDFSTIHISIIFLSYKCASVHVHPHHLEINLFHIPKNKNFKQCWNIAIVSTIRTGYFVKWLGLFQAFLTIGTFGNIATKCSFLQLRKIKAVSVGTIKTKRWYHLGTSVKRGWVFSSITSDDAAIGASLLLATLTLLIELQPIAALSY